MAIKPTFPERIVGLLVGGAVGDAIGLPAEGMSAERIARWWPHNLQHRFVFGYGMISDDTEHALMTAQALIVAGDDVEKFRRCLAWKLRWWIIGFPAGAGLATAKACLRLWLGISPKQSGVNSAGNGPAMRSAVIGVKFWDNTKLRRSFLEASTYLTHTDKRAMTAALAVSEAAAWIVGGNLSRDFALQLSKLGDDPEWRRIANQVCESLEAGRTVAEFAATLGLRSCVTGYAYHSVPVAIYAWMRHGGDFEKTIESVVRCGGDTDTVAAIAGSLAACEVGEHGIPQDWINGVKDWPRSISFTERIGSHVSQRESNKSGGYFWPGIIPRNLLFIVIVLFHGFRRLLPPFAKRLS